HNEVREITKTRRGLGNNDSAQDFVDLKRIEHNFCRPHSGLPNKLTPAQAAGIDLALGDDKLKSLIIKSAEVKEQKKREYNIEAQLGKRIEYISITREKDCTSVKTNGWIPKPVWREINDILLINGFHWLEDGADSKWIKLRD
ncbi:MAG: hypothetical protein ACRD5H_11370, partial [Nitrososphaerales archaeon]